MQPINILGKVFVSQEDSSAAHIPVSFINDSLSSALMGHSLRNVPAELERKCWETKKTKVLSFW